jgi:hypothetical protein
LKVLGEAKDETGGEIIAEQDQELITKCLETQIIETETQSKD